MKGSDVWQLVDEQRASTHALVAGLTPAQWDTPSLCDRWTVRDVAAHLTMPLLGMTGLVGMALRYPGSTNRLIERGSRRLASQFTDDQLAQRLEALVGHHRPFPGLSVHEALVDAVVHHADIAIPVGAPISGSVQTAARAADRVISYGGKGNAKVFRRTAWQEVRLVADDCEWTAGDGPLVSGSMLDLLLLLTGRVGAVARLSGPGVDALSPMPASG